MTFPLIEKAYEAVAKGLREFGYPDVNKEMIREAHKAWQRRQEPADIIAMFAVKEFDEYPQIFGEQQEYDL